MQPDMEQKVHLVLRMVEVALNGVEGQVGHAMCLRRQSDLTKHICLGSAPKQAAFSWPQNAQQPCLPCEGAKGFQTCSR